MDVFKTTWKCYIPAAISGAASVAFLLGSNSVHAKRNAAIATAYKLSETALTDYKKEVIETIGEEKAKLIQDKVAQKHVDEHPVSNNQVVIAGSGKQLCYDGISGRYFESDIQTIRAAVNTINETMVYEMYASLGDFYNEIGLPPTTLSDELGWNLDDGQLEISYGSAISDDGPEQEIDLYVSKIAIIDEKTDQMKTRKRSKEISEKIKEYCGILADAINVPKTFIELRDFVQQINRTGSETPRLVYMYQSALYLYNLNRANSPFNFYVVDTPNQQGQDAENLESIFKSLELFLSEDGQVIVGTERETGMEGKASNVIKLTEKRR